MHTDPKYGEPSDYVEIIDDEMDGDNYPKDFYSTFQRSTDADIRNQLQDLKNIIESPKIARNELEEQIDLFKGMKYHDPIS